MADLTMGNTKVIFTPFIIERLGVLVLANQYKRMSDPGVLGAPRKYKICFINMTVNDSKWQQ